MSISLWAARLERPLTEAEAQAAQALLPSPRRERVPRVRQDEPLCAYLLLRRALEERYGWRDLPDIALAPGGKPCFPDHPEVQFNLSHTAGAVLAGLSDRPVGVDIERVRPVSRRVMARLSLAGAEEDFFRQWVRREARSKWSGEGVAAMLRSEPPMRDGEFYHELEIFPGYAAGVASCHADPPEIRLRLSLDGLF